MIVIAILCQPANDVPIRPVDLQGPGVFVENMVLEGDQQGPGTLSPRTYIDRHLVHMDALLNTEFRYQHIEGGVQDANDSGLPDDGTIPLGQVRNKYTEIQVGGLLLCKSSTLLLAVDIKMLIGVRNPDEGPTHMLHC